MKITVISCSTRDGSQSLRVAQYVCGQLQAMGVEADVIDLNTQRLPLYDDTHDGPWKAVWEPMHTQLEAAEGFVFVAPEWNGNVGPGFLNLMLYADDELAHKPAMMIGVSSGRGGTYPLTDMRVAGYKNRRYVIIPENAIINHVKETLVDGQIVDQVPRERMEYGLKMLLEYAKALAQVRSSGVVDFEKFGNGV